NLVRRPHHRTSACPLRGIRLHQRQIVWCADVGTLLLQLVGRTSRDRPGRSIVAAIVRRQIFGGETAVVTRRTIDDEVEVPLHDVGPPRDPGELSSDPCAIALYASRSLSPGATQHSLPSGRYPSGGYRTVRAAGLAGTRNRSERIFGPPRARRSRGIR